MANNLKTAFLLTAMTVFLVLVGQAIGGRNGAVLAFCFAGAMNFISYFYSDKIAIMSSGAQAVTREELPRVYQIVERLCAKTGLPMPKIFVIPTDSPNAFATGRNPEHASVAVTAGILDLLNDDEMEGVLAHELGHVRNRDILISSVAATFAGAVTILARMAGWAAMFGGGGTRPRARRRPAGRHRHDDSCAHCRHAHPDGGFALARIPGRRHGRALYGKSRGAGQRAAQDGKLCDAGPAARFARDGAYVHHCAAAGRDELWQPVLDPSADGRADCPADRNATAPEVTDLRWPEVTFGMRLGYCLPGHSGYNLDNVASTGFLASTGLHASTRSGTGARTALGGARQR